MGATLYVDMELVFDQVAALVRDRTPPGPDVWVRDPGVPVVPIRDPVAELTPEDVIRCRRRVLAVAGGTLNVGLVAYPFDPGLCVVIGLSREYLAVPVPDEDRKAEIKRAIEAASDVLNRSGVPWMPVQSFSRPVPVPKWRRFAAGASSLWRRAWGSFARPASLLRACAGRAGG